MDSIARILANQQDLQTPLVLQITNVFQDISVLLDLMLNAFQTSVSVLEKVVQKEAIQNAKLVILVSLVLVFLLLLLLFLVKTATNAPVEVLVASAKNQTVKVFVQEISTTTILAQKKDPIIIAVWSRVNAHRSQIKLFLAVIHLVKVNWIKSPNVLALL